jgi:hypothetical protein
MKKPKTFDCVEMMHRGAERIYEITKDMTLEEEIVYWRERDRLFQEEHNRRAAGNAPRESSAAGISPL